jgi:hypothetical protein
LQSEPNLAKGTWVPDTHSQTVIQFRPHSCSRTVSIACFPRKLHHGTLMQYFMNHQVHRSDARRHDLVFGMERRSTRHSHANRARFRLLSSASMSLSGSSISACLGCTAANMVTDKHIGSFSLADRVNHRRCFYAVLESVSSG